MLILKSNCSGRKKMNNEEKIITSHPQKKLDLEVVGLSKQHLSQQLYYEHKQINFIFITSER